MIYNYQLLITISYSGNSRCSYFEIYPHANVRFCPVFLFILPGQMHTSCNNAVSPCSFLLFCLLILSVHGMSPGWNRWLVRLVIKFRGRNLILKGSLQASVVFMLAWLSRNPIKSWWEEWEKTSSLTLWHIILRLHVITYPFAYEKFYDRDMHQKRPQRYHWTSNWGQMAS